MRAAGGLALLVIMGCLSTNALAQNLEQNLCIFSQPESRVSDLSFQGSFSWYDGPYADDRNRAVSASVMADYQGLRSTSALEQGINAKMELRGADVGWSLSVAGSGDWKSFFRNDLFGIGAFGMDINLDSGLEIALTGGVGKGRFHDVAPLAQAIRIQNALLDHSILLAPIGDDALDEIARILGEIGPGSDEKLVAVTQRLLDTGLIGGEEVGVLGLLSIEEIMESEETRLCGADIQARIGASFSLLPVFRVSATGNVLAQYAIAPDPVSQLDSSLEAKFRLADPEQFHARATASYNRRLPDGWTARASYRLELDRMWSTASETLISQAASASLTTQILGSMGLSLVGSVQHELGDEEITISLAAYVEADLL